MIRAHSSDVSTSESSAVSGHEQGQLSSIGGRPVVSLSLIHILRAHETLRYLVCRLLLEKKNTSMSTQPKKGTTSSVNIEEVLQRIDRNLFVSSKHGARILGHSIPSTAIARKILQEIPDQARHHALHIGTGGGYLTALVAHFYDQVFAIEKQSLLARKAEQNFKELGLENIQLKVGDGSHAKTCLLYTSDAADE